MAKPCSNLRRVSGFTLMELMITVIVISVLMAIAVPSFRGTMRRSYVSNALSTVNADLQFARAEAANRHQFVSVCRSTNGLVCANGQDFDAGYIIYAYNAAAGGTNQVLTTLSTGMTLLRYTQAQPRVSIQATDANVLTFGQIGQPEPNGTRTNMNFTVCARLQNQTTGVGTNNNESLGGKLALGQSGSITASKLAATATCAAS
ncbi:GspH/FimT family pseudopilin [Luteibacter aegosomatissinici]|uniref:GspH/FimT family pseudopilin n=1 Tax=Luteibacter aegosomatissinici TaxID=2911539 RepID=UPI001FFBBE95|nr:GspH/FimT family pseudopilin [Luteibacter aegosomatissinici]UPG96725.1 GspH/FimT family pseudopilin [Luteibacter aegosomatissinici]